MRIPRNRICGWLGEAVQPQRLCDLGVQPRSQLSVLDTIITITPII